ncbi:MAG: autotransporter-associated beta strand repeat-containing protein [Verrucomicrobiota bacterium]
MKPKNFSRNLFQNPVTLTSIVVATLAIPAAQAGTIYWDGTTAGWDSTANWSTASGAATPDPLTVPGIADDAVFNITTVNGAETVSLNANQSANSLTFNNTGTTLLQGNTVASANRVLTIGAGGITVNSGAGAVTIGSTTTNQNVAVTLGAGQSWINNSANALNIVNAVGGLAGANQTLTIGGTGDTTWGAGNSFGATSGGILNLTKSGAGILQLGVTSSGTANNLGGGILNVTGGTVNIGGRDLVVGGLTGGGTVGNGSGTTRWLFVNNGGDNTFSGTLQNGAGAGLLGLNKSGTGTLALTGAATYTSTTTINGGTIEFGSTSSGGAGRTVSTATGSGVVFAAGDGGLRSSSDGTGTASLTIGIGSTRTAGATANYMVSGGVNGISNSINLTKAAGFIDQGSFFNGANFAVMDGLNTYVRGISYGIDAGAVTSGTTATLAGTAHQEITGDITAQSTAAFTTLKDNGNHALTLASGATVTVNGILKTGNVAGGATISGGAGIQAASGLEMVIRTDGANDALTISTPILANGANALTKSGAGSLTLSAANTYTGITTSNAGNLTISGSILNGGILLRGGTMNVSGAVGTGNVNIAGGTFNVSGSLGTNGTNGNFRVGTATGTPAVMNILPGAVMNTRFNLFVGDAGTGFGGGAVYQTGGSLTLTQAVGVDNLRIGSNGTGYGYYNLSAGSVTSNRPAIGASLADTVGVVEVSGGNFNALEQLHVAAGSAGSSGLLNVTGGTVAAGTDIRLLSLQAGTAGATSLAVVNVGGGVGQARITTGNSATQGLNLAQTNTVAGATGVLNLLANGTLVTGRVLGTQTAATTHFNFNGGKLEVTAINAGTIFNDATLDAVNVYSGGGTIDNSGTAITINRGLLAPTASGVSGTSLAVTGGGSGYIGAPLVKLTGGTGTGATGYAVLTAGVVSSVVITSPGIGYSPGDTLTASFFGGGFTTPATNMTGIAVAANTSGGMTFSGSGTTILSGTSTYTGATVVSAGTLLVNGALGNTAVTVQTGATLGGTNGTIGSAGASVTVNAGGTLAPGSSIGALAVNGNVTVNGTFAYEYDGGTPSGDVLDVNGMLTLNNATLSLADFGGDSYTVGDKFTLAAYDLLGIGSSFNGYADDTAYVFNGGSWRLDYNDATAGTNGGVGSNYITITAVPEPASLLLGALGLLGLLRRRRVS